MKKIFLILSLFLSINIGYSIQPMNKIFDCTEMSINCDMKVYAKSELGTITFRVNMLKEIKGYKIYLYDTFGRKLIEKNIEPNSNFNKSGLTNGLYLIKITNGREVYTKRILVS